MPLQSGLGKRIKVLVIGDEIEFVTEGNKFGE
jgi:hypothetical protein